MIGGAVPVGPFLYIEQHTKGNTLMLYEKVILLYTQKSNRK